MGNKKYHLSEKIVIIINGKGGVGKDTLCNTTSYHFFSDMISAITPIKEIATICGWKGDKSAKSRKFLSDLKRLLIDYNDLPNNYLLAKYRDFLFGENDILFVQIREGDQIDAFCKQISSHYCTLLIKSSRSDFEEGQLGNISDDDVEKYRYDYIYWNNASLNNIGDDFFSFFVDMLKKEKITVFEENGCGTRYNYK